MAPGQGCGSAPQTPECSPHLWVLWVQEGLRVQDTASRGISIPEGVPSENPKGILLLGIYTSAWASLQSYPNTVLV